MRLVDANVILRYVLKDHPEMSEQARKTIEAGACTTIEVLAEVIYVLRGVYKAERGEMAGVLINLLREIEIEKKPAVLYALSVYGKTTLDFVDCVLAGYHHEMGIDIMTFDKKLNRLLDSV